jgi:alkylhydroperoxidase family enzyme
MLSRAACANPTAIFNTQEIAMAHIQLQEGAPGIRDPMAFRPETAKPMRELAEVLLRSPHRLSPGEREAIATYFSSQNDCYYCQTIHGYAAAPTTIALSWIRSNATTRKRQSQKS